MLPTARLLTLALLTAPIMATAQSVSPPNADSPAPLADGRTAGPPWPSPVPAGEADYGRPVAPVVQAAYQSTAGDDRPGAVLSPSPSPFPRGETHKDEYFGEQEIYRNKFAIAIPYKPSKTGFKLSELFGDPKSSDVTIARQIGVTHVITGMGFGGVRKEEYVEHKTPSSTAGQASSGTQIHVLKSVLADR